MTFEELQELLAEQFSCDAEELNRGEALGVEIDERDLNEEMTVGELWRFATDVAENADM